MIFLTSIGRIFVPQAKANELVRRLGGDPTVPAILDADGRGVRLSAEEKEVVLAALERWMQETSLSDLGEELGRLRYELMRDLELPPFGR